MHFYKFRQTLTFSGKGGKPKNSKNRLALCANSQKSYRFEFLVPEPAMSQFKGKIDGEIILGMKQISLERYFSSAIINKKVSILSAEYVSQTL